MTGAAHAFPMPQDNVLQDVWEGRVGEADGPRARVFQEAGMTKCFAGLISGLSDAAFW